MARVHNHPGFGIRATAVIVDRGRVLGHRPATDAEGDWWALPGGGPNLQEPTSATVVRLLWVIEHFFGPPDDPHHGIDFVHLVDVPAGWHWRDHDEFLSEGEESYGRLLQRWLPLNDDGLSRLYPECLRAMLLAPLPDQPGHVVHWQR